MRRKLTIPDALATQIAEYAQEKHCTDQVVLGEALALGLNMLRMRSDQVVQVVKRREEDARSFFSSDS